MNDFNVRVTKSIDKVPNLMKKIRLMTIASGFHVDVGITSDKVERTDLSAMFPGDKSWNKVSPYNNAELAYLHENADDLDVNFPGRPFMAPAMEKCQLKIYKILSVATRRHFKNRKRAVEEGLIEAGELLSSSMKQTISEGINPPLDLEYLVYKRGDQDNLPLKDTEQMFNAIGYEVKK